MSADALGLPGYADAVPVATGGTSTVWRAREEAFDRLVAVKVLAFPVLDDDARRRFVRELSLAGRLSGHPGVLTVHASGFTADGRPYLTSEWCPAGSLADVVGRTGPLTDAQVAAVGVAVADALQAAHDAGVVHRDVKPQNVLVTAYGRPALADFGIAVATAEVTSPTDSLTPAHAAPEVLQGGTATAASDVWGLGSTLWTLLTGAAPFAAAAGEGVLPAMLRTLHDPLPDAPASPVADVLRALLVKDAAARPTAAQAADRLRPLAAGAAALAAAPTLPPVPPASPRVEPTVTRARPTPAAPAADVTAVGVFPVLPPSPASADATVHRPDRPPVAVAQEAPPRRRGLVAAGAAAVAVALVAGTAWTLSRDEPRREAVAVAAARASAATPVAPTAAPVPGGAAPATVPGAAAPAPVGPAGGAADPVPQQPVEAAPAVPAPADPAPADPAPAGPAAPDPAPARPAPAAASPAPPPGTHAPPQAAPQPRRIPVYRCDRGAEDLLYSTNPGCKAGYTQVRQAWSVTKDTGVPSTTPLWRLRNPSTGVHLLTWSGEERSALLGGGWEADGQVGWVRTSEAAGWTRVWRLHDGRRYAYTGDASLQVWQDRGFRVEGRFWT